VLSRISAVPITDLVLHLEIALAQDGLCVRRGCSHAQGPDVAWCSGTRRLISTAASFSLHALARQSLTVRSLPKADLERKRIRLVRKCCAGRPRPPARTSANVKGYQMPAAESRRSTKTPQWIIAVEPAGYSGRR